MKKEERTRILGFISLLLLASLILILGSSGCLKKKSPRGYQNIPPETFIFVQGEVDTVTAKQEICWYGNDPDGQVIGYEWAIDDSSLRTFTESNCSTFVFSSGMEPIVHLFFVWAIDDSGARDTTPASLKIPVVNTPPRVYLDTYRIPPDTTFPVATFFWIGEDDDGNETITGYRYKLDYWTEWTIVSPDTNHVSLTGIEPGVRTFSIQAFDEAGALSDTALWNWTVTPAEGEILVVDDDTTLQGTDSLLARYLDQAGIPYSFWRIDRGLPPSSRDVHAIINELNFQVILWATGASSHIGDASSSLMDFLEAGKRILLTGKAVLGSELSELERSYFHVDSVTHLDRILPNGQLLLSEVEGYPETLEVNAPIIDRVDGFLPDSEAETLYRGPTQFFGESSLGSRYPKGGPARVILLTFPLEGVDGRGNVPQLLDKIFEEFGILFRTRGQRRWSR